MNIKAAFFQHLTQSPALVAVVADRIYPVALPQKPDYPAVLFRRMKPIIRENSTKGYSGLTTSLFEVTAWAPDVDGVAGYDTASQVAALIWNRLHGFRGMLGGAAGVETKVVLATDDGEDVFDDELQIYGDRLVYQVVHREPVPDLT